MVGFCFGLGSFGRALMGLGVALCVVSCGGPDGNPPEGSPLPGAGSSGDGGSSGSSGSSGSAGNESQGGTEAAAGGSGGQAGAGNEGGADLGVSGAGAEGGGPQLGPDATFQRVDTVPADKIDLLLMIDNSISMADKQRVFQDALPLLVQRLVTPVCVDASGNSLGTHAGNDGRCALGEPEFSPIRDIHIAVVTSSLGSNGGTLCSATDSPPTDDKGRLLPSVRSGLKSWDGAGFLAWDPEGTRNAPAGETNAAALVSDFTDMVNAVGDTGCGYEATLESWYRFLVDPDPPSAVTRDATSQVMEVTYPDAVILEQRARFLRPDSLVGIVMLTDENDCSILDRGAGWLVGTTSRAGVGSFTLPRATRACATNPNDECCLSCASQAAPAGCTQPAEDPECQLDAYSSAEDSSNLRCYDQKRRFGIDMLHPLTRYVDGLTSTQLLNRKGESVPNPLFVAASGASRDLSRVFLMGVVGVPWQDLADEASLSHASRLRYLDYAELVERDRWSLMLGEAGERPRDGLMFETPLDRSTLGFAPHPLTRDELQPATSTDPRANGINGHESFTQDSDLQFACTFPLTTTRDCSLEGELGCDCRSSDGVFNRALCQPPGGGAASTTQYYAKAYPSLRQLAVLRDFGAISGNAVVASICPKVVTSNTPSTDPNYGYNPAVTALIDRMKNALSPACLGEPLAADASGQVPCHALEVARSAGSCGGCDGPGREAATPAASEALLARLRAARFCGVAGQPSCEELCVCEVKQLASDEGLSCRQDATTAATVAGFCYIDAALGLGDSALVDHCPAERKRRLRFVGENAVQSGVSTFLMCEG